VSESPNEVIQGAPSSYKFLSNDFCLWSWEGI